MSQDPFALPPDDPRGQAARVEETSYRASNPNLPTQYPAPSGLGGEPAYGSPAASPYDAPPYGAPPYGAAPSGYGAPPPYGAYPQPMAGQKSKVAAGLFGIFLGALGVHRFYLGYTGVGLTMLLLSVLSFGILAGFVALWGLVEGIVYLTATQGSYSVDAQGRPLGS